MFDYSGLSEQRLMQLTDSNLANRGISRRVYWSSGVYSIARCLRLYAGYPDHLPLYVYMQHGVYFDNYHPQTHEIENDAEAMVVFNRPTLNGYRNVSAKPCHLVTMPYVWYRRSKNITQTKDARGTLVFPAHSTFEVDSVFDINRYSALLAKLPDEFRPVCLCFHDADIRKGMYKEFKKHGWPIYTAGCPHDIAFVDRFYDLLRHFKFTMSNLVGSYLFYSVEMGIPFSVNGEPPVFINRSDPNLPLGEYGTESDEYNRMHAAFSGLHRIITPEQKELVSFSLGLDGGLNPEELNRILWAAYRRRGNRFLDTVYAFRHRIKNLFRRHVREEG